MFYSKKFLLWLLVPVLFLGASWGVGAFLDAQVLQNNILEEEVPTAATPENFHSIAPEISSVEARGTEEIKATQKEREKVDQQAEEVAFFGDNQYLPPMGEAEKRINKKTFGMYISPENSPIQADIFRGFHAGVDWEVFPHELHTDVPVKAVCSGKLKLKKMASGYGGVVVQECDLKGESITVVYGHMKLSSVDAKISEFIPAGEVVGLLGADKSAETDGRRKHLHLAFHHTDKINIKGYLANKEELDGWIDPCLYVCE